MWTIERGLIHDPNMTIVWNFHMGGDMVDDWGSHVAPRGR